jgi:phosphohistidine phosphatase
VEAHDVRPELAICSPALRTTQTLGRLLEALGSPEVAVEEGLYHASAGGLLERARRLPDALNEVVFVGHNPGLADLCLLLTRPGVERERVAVNLPTGALATLELDAGAWSALAAGCGDLVRLVLARELAQ